MLFRTRSGKARVLDAFCPHLGAHLGHGGRVMGDTIRCPFHAWQLDGATGEVTHIPYCERIPARAKVRAWDVQEKNGFVWIWYHSDAEPPQWDFDVQPELCDEEWSEPRAFEKILEAHIQDTHENNNDPVHFFYVHGAPAIPESEIHFTPGSTHYRILSRSEHQYPFGTFKMTLSRDSWGLGLTSIRMEGVPGASVLLYSATTPIDESRVHSRWLLTATRNMVDVAGEEFMKNLTEGVEQDLEIWKHKVHRARPVLCEEDRYLAQYRRWARQFYTQPAGEDRRQER